jgi:hypothetical protein
MQLSKHFFCNRLKFEAIKNILNLALNSLIKRAKINSYVYWNSHAAIGDFIACALAQAVFNCAMLQYRNYGARSM